MLLSLQRDRQLLDVGEAVLGVEVQNTADFITRNIWLLILEEFQLDEAFYVCLLHLRLLAIIHTVDDVCLSHRVVIDLLRLIRVRLLDLCLLIS